MKKNTAGYAPEKAPFQEYLRIFKGIKMPWLFIFLIFAATIATTYAGLGISMFTGDMVDAQGNVPVAQLVSFALGYAVMSACTAGRTIFEQIASERINLGLRQKLWRKIVYTKQSCYDADGGESLVSRVTTDCDFASKLLTTVVSLLSLAVSMFTYLTQMYAMNVALSNYMLLFIPLSILIGWGFAKLKFLIAQRTQAMLARTTAYLAERTSNLALIKTSNAQTQELRQGEANFQEQFKTQIQTGLMGAFSSALQTLFNIVSVLIPFLVGGGLVAAGKLTAGEVVAFYMISSTVGGSFTNVIFDVGTIRQSNGALARVINAMKLPDEQNASGSTIDEPDQDLSFVDVEFGYGEADVLRRVSCRIPKGQVTAVIGSNGSGKSTMFKLIERLYDPRKGSIRFGEKDVGSFDLHAWRKAFAMVAQGSPLMEGTVRENICYGCERPVSEDELIKVAKQARVYDFVSKLPQGFSTPVTAGGANFSGGQRQCIAIARAMMCSPDYLLLDEATSNLDAHSERAVMEALEELMRNRTTIVIAHSLSAIRRADHVIVLRDGQVEASGSPKQILEASGNYLTKVMGRKGPQPV
ncbi:MAG: ABC transporter ATP-binding protein/permease [Oscillospiraceae bacterium]|nr:ABC transporter ATP-binding protein/permease [Oscillospiraceae bacterium]